MVLISLNVCYINNSCTDRCLIVLSVPVFHFPHPAKPIIRLMLAVF